MDDVKAQKQDVKAIKQDVKAIKQEIRQEIYDCFKKLSIQELEILSKKVENRLFGFANFLESKIVLLYINHDCEVPTEKIIKKCLQSKIIVILPIFVPNSKEIKFVRINNFKEDLILDSEGQLIPNLNTCKNVPIKCLDIAIIPGLAFDEKGSRIGKGNRNYDKLIPKLNITTRKVALGFEFQMQKLILTESYDKHVDIIITDNRIIYKI